MSEPMIPAPPAPPAPPAASGSSKATTALVLGILGFLCCQLCAPFAWFIGKNELKAIKEGTSPASGEGTAKAGMILGIIGTIFLVFGIIWIFLMGGLAVLSAVANSAGN
jgi:hypothetical protein